MYDRDALLAVVDLADLADDLLGPRSGSAGSPMWSCPNDRHAQSGRTPPLSVFTSRRGEQRWRCHGCGEGGTAIDLVLACRGGTFREAMGYLAARAGHHNQRLDSQPPRRPPRPLHEQPTGCRDAEGLQAYVDQCAERLWKPEGRVIRRWLTHTRGIPADVLHENCIGADLGSRSQPRPDGMPRAHGAVLPAISAGRAVYVQIRVPHPERDRPKYLNPTSDLASNPRLARMRPVDCQHPEIIVTEGSIDALSAAAGGFRAVGVLSATYCDESVALALSRLPHPLVLAFDADDAGRAGSERLAALLEAKQRPPVVLDLGSGDLNDAMRRSENWPARLSASVDHTIASRSAVGVEL